MLVYLGVLLLVLPPLIYSAAVAMSWREFRFNLRPIGMLAIGAGAREESLRFIEQLGVRNVLVDSRPVASEEELQQRRRSSPGLTERSAPR